MCEPRNFNVAGFRGSDLGSLLKRMGSSFNEGCRLKLKACLKLYGVGPIDSMGPTVENR